MVGIETKVEKNETFGELYKRLQNRETLNIGLVEDIRAGVMQNFDTESDDGKSWQNLALSTLRDRVRKKRPYPQYKMLQRNTHTGLRGSVQTQADNDGGLIYTNKVYARAQQLGNPKNKLPARPFLTVTKKASQDAAKTINNWYRKVKNEVL